MFFFQLHMLSFIFTVCINSEPDPVIEYLVPILCSVFFRKGNLQTTVDVYCH